MIITVERKTTNPTHYLNINSGRVQMHEKRNEWRDFEACRDSSASSLLGFPLIFIYEDSDDQILSFVLYLFLLMCSLASEYMNF